jgi:hypothetical protein
MRRAAKRVLLEVVGWVLVVAGIAALVLPGPGLLLLAAGLFVLSQQYAWAERRVDPILDRALIGAAMGVESPWKIGLSALFALGLVACGVLWIQSPPTPGWWSLPEGWWLPGGAATGVTQVASGILALGLIVWSYRRYHGNPEAVAELRERAAARAVAQSAGQP